MTHHPILNCDDPEWGARLRSYLNEQTEVQLINFDLATHAKLGEDLATEFAMRMELVPHRSGWSAHFKKT